MSTENTVKLLWDCANALDAETHTNKLLKSYYMLVKNYIDRYNKIEVNFIYKIFTVTPVAK